MEKNNARFKTNVGKVLSKVESVVSIVSYELWIEPLELIDYKEKLVIATDSQNAKRQILKIIFAYQLCHDLIF